MELRIEQINVSDDKYLLASITVESGSFVKKGEIVYSVESSKATVDVEAPCDGFIYFSPKVEELEEYPVGCLIAQIVDSEQNPFEKESEDASKDAVVNDAVEQSENTIQRIEQVFTEAALELMKKYSIPRESFSNSFIAKQDVLDKLKSKDLGCWGYNNTIRRVAIIGAGRGSVQVLDLISHLDGYVASVIFDDTPEKQGTYLYGVPIVGPVVFNDIAKNYYDGLFDCIVNSVSTSVEFRKKCYESLSEKGVPFCNLIHPTTIIGQNVRMGTGNIIFPLSHIGPNAEIGNDCFITAKTSLEHHNIVGDHCCFGPGVFTSGSVTIKECVKFGAGIYVEPWITIGEWSLIASGCIITNNIPARVVVRNPQKYEIKERKL